MSDDSDILDDLKEVNILDGWQVVVFDGAEHARRIFGGEESRCEMFPHQPDPDWRIQLTSPAGAVCTLPVTATAAYIAAIVERETSHPNAPADH